MRFNQILIKWGVLRQWRENNNTNDCMGRASSGERHLPRGLWQSGAKSVGGLGNEGMIFCPVIATVPVTQLDLIGWLCVRCWCSSSSGGSAAAVAAAIQRGANSPNSFA
jgi:hypothetical protein